MQILKCDTKECLKESRVYLRMFWSSHVRILIFCVFCVFFMWFFNALTMGILLIFNSIWIEKILFTVMLCSLGDALKSGVESTVTNVKLERGKAWSILGREPPRPAWQCPRGISKGIYCKVAQLARRTPLVCLPSSMGSLRCIRPSQRKSRSYGIAIAITPFTKTTTSNPRSPLFCAPHSELQFFASIQLPLSWIELTAGSIDVAALARSLVGAIPSDFAFVSAI